jgi:hypothetical protein
VERNGYWCVLLPVESFRRVYRRVGQPVIELLQKLEEEVAGPEGFRRRLRSGRSARASRGYVHRPFFPKHRDSVGMLPHRGVSRTEFLAGMDVATDGPFE